MNNKKTILESDFEILTDQDMFAIAQDMNAIEPGAGTSFTSTLIDIAPSIETAALIGFFCLGMMLVYPVAKKTRFAKRIRLHF